MPHKMLITPPSGVFVYLHYTGCPILAVASGQWTPAKFVRGPIEAICKIFNVLKKILRI